MGKENGPLDNKANRVVARFTDGRMIKGYTYDFSPNKKSFHIISSTENDRKNADEIALADLKAVFFVDSFEGRKDHPAAKDLNAQEGQIDSTIKVKATFYDGETMTGSTLTFNRDREGFFMTPIDREGNNTRIFVIFNAVEKMETWK
ncbi:MAG: hypothetical protein WCO26_05730 [Deltaproteobacteria bacterium]